jgi:biotin transport system substrate-specific component
VNVEYDISCAKTDKAAYFGWLRALSWRTKLMLIIPMAVFTGITAQLRVPLPFTPVPITGQVCAVLLSGVLLGSVGGMMSMVLYVGAGFAGIPWFTNAAVGMPIGPTAGYIIGFIPAAFVIGWAMHSQLITRSFLMMVSVMVIGVAVIYTCGALHFAFFMNTSVLTTLQCAVLPFIPVDICKIIIAATIARVIIPLNR